MSRARLRIVLAGAGHAHLHVLQSADELRAVGVEPILVSPATFDYSGLATAVLSGALPPGQARLDVAALAARFGVPHVPAEVTGVDRGARRLSLSDGQELSYDAVSFNVGSVIDFPGAPEGDGATWPVKPLHRLPALRSEVETRIREGGGSPAIVVAGGGPTGFEVAAALVGLSERNGAPPELRLVCRSPPDWAPARALARLAAHLTGRGVILEEGEVVSRERGRCRLTDGRTLPCDLLVLATGLRPPTPIAALGLPLSPDGRLEVGSDLRTTRDPAIFAVGDCAVIAGAPRPAAGVFGVRAAPVLVHNLGALANGSEMRPYAPQSRWLSILDLGDGTGLALRGGLWSQGRGALALKRRIDLGFLDRLRAASGEVLEQ